MISIRSRSLRGPFAGLRQAGSRSQPMCAASASSNQRSPAGSGLVEAEEMEYSAVCLRTKVKGGTSVASSKDTVLLIRGNVVMDAQYGVAVASFCKGARFEPFPEIAQKLKRTLFAQCRRPPFPTPGFFDDGRFSWSALRALLRSWRHRWFLFALPPAGGPTTACVWRAARDGPTGHYQRHLEVCGLADARERTDAASCALVRWRQSWTNLP